jgi:uncharacterized membrane protein YgcG
MGTTDGLVIGMTTILNNGPNNQRFNIVITGDGFQNTTTDQAAFDARCQDIINEFRREPWFGQGLLAGINIHRVNVGSTDQGADDPATCADGSTATAVAVNTYFDSTFCTAAARRCLGADWDLVRDTISGQLPEWHAVVVLVNTTQRGGCASGNVFATALSADWLDVVMHELGHAAFRLGDEYSTWAGCSSGETDRDNAPPGEPAAVNITTTATLAGLKWGHLVRPETPVPTKTNPNCGQCDLQPNPRPDDTEIGLFEGAGYYHCGRYRPAFTCRMRDSGQFFCRVCADAVQDRLRPFFGTAPVLTASVFELDFGAVAQGTVATLGFRLSNAGTTPVSGIALSSSSPRFVASATGGTTLAPGDELDVTVSFGPVFMNGAQSGTLSVTSSAPTLTIAERAVVLAPQARMRVVTADGSLTLDFGDVARRLTMYRWFEVRNLRTAVASQLRVTLGAPPAGFDYAPGTPLSFTLAAPGAALAYTAQRIYLAFAAPATGTTSASGTLVISTADDPITPTVSLTLLARAIDPPAVDSVLVLDRSGSMSEPTGVPGATKMDLAIQAANLYIGLLKDGDRIGIVRFNNRANNPADVLQSMVVAGDPTTGAGRAAARATLTAGNLTPSGATSIGGGAILGSAVLDEGAANARAVIVLTDGLQNTSPNIATATTTIAGKTPRQRVFAIGLGLNQLETSLDDLATTNNGVAQITGELVGAREFLLQKLYVQILTDVADLAFVSDPTEVLLTGERRASDVYVGEVDVEVDFILVFRRYAARGIEVWLEAPDGTIVRPDEAGSVFPNVMFVAGAGHAFFRVQLPAFPERPRAHVGRWRVWLASRGRELTLTHALPARDDAPPFVYSVLSTARSNLMLRGALLQTAHTPGSVMTLVLEATLYGQPIVLDEPVEARFVRPDGVTRSVRLTSSGEGQYRAVFEDTYLLGAYHAWVQVSATTPARAEVTRYRHLTGTIFHHDPKGGSDGGDSESGGSEGGGSEGGGSEGGGTQAEHCARAKRALAGLERLLRATSKTPGRWPAEVAGWFEVLNAFVAACCKKSACGCGEPSADVRQLLSRVEALLQSRPREEG